MSAPAVRDRRAHRPGAPSAPKRDATDWAGLVEVYFRFHAVLVYVFLYLPIVVVVAVRVQRHEPASSTELGRALSIKLVRDRPSATRSCQDRSDEQLHRRASPTPSWPPLFGTMAALGLQRVGKKIRLTFDTLTYMSVIVPEIVIALATLVLLRDRRSTSSTIDVTGDQAQLRLPDDHRGARAVQHQPRPAARPGAAVRHGPDA